MAWAAGQDRRGFVVPCAGWFESQRRQELLNAAESPISVALKSFAYSHRNLWRHPFREYLDRNGRLRANSVEQLVNATRDRKW